MPELAWWAWTLLALGALIIGLSKAAVPGANTLTIAIFAAILPARESTGTLLVLLICGDLIALAMYRRSANWRELLRLAPAVIVGVLLGVVFLAFADDLVVRRSIGVILLLVIAVTLVRRRLTRTLAVERRQHPVIASTYGALGGFTTMAANAGGPVMSMYFLASRFSVTEFLGTAAWFFFLVNVIKLPFSIGLGIITVPGLLIDLVLIPGVILGALAGRWLVGRISQRTFEWIVVVLTVVGAVYLLVF
jgi:uncharacterized protein